MFFIDVYWLIDVIIAETSFTFFLAAADVQSKKNSIWVTPSSGTSYRVSIDLTKTRDIDIRPNARINNKKKCSYFRPGASIKKLTAAVVSPSRAFQQAW